MEAGSCCHGLPSSDPLYWVYPPCKYSSLLMCVCSHVSYIIQQVVVLKDQKTRRPTKNRLRWHVKPLALFEQLPRLLEKKIASNCTAVVWNFHWSVPCTTLSGVIYCTRSPRLPRFLLFLLSSGSVLALLQTKSPVPSNSSLVLW